MQIGQSASGASTVDNKSVDGNPCCWGDSPNSATNWNEKQPEKEEVALSCIALERSAPQQISPVSCDL